MLSTTAVRSVRRRTGRRGVRTVTRSNARGWLRSRRVVERAKKEIEEKMAMFGDFSTNLGNSGGGAGPSNTSNETET